ncbi:hypothetical protein JCM5296_004247 [Sporobolomyces johnsonii]
MSTASSPPVSGRRQTTQRRAYSRVKDASRRGPSFLGADDDDDPSTNPFDFDQPSPPRPTSRPHGNAPDKPAPAADPFLGNAFDDLFNLDPDPAAGGLDDALLQGSLDAADDGVPQKKRRAVAKLDETRLLGPSGFPQLRDDLRKLRLKGKGHETQDLKRVLTMYQLWSHQMYPKTNLRDTLHAVEKLCHKRSLQRALKQYKDEDRHGKARQVDAAAAADEDLDALFGTGATDFASTSSSSLTKKKDAVADPDPDADLGAVVDFDDLLADEDELMAELEAQAQAQAEMGSGSGASNPAARARTRTLTPTPTPTRDLDEDDEAEAALREMESELLM